MAVPATRGRAHQKIQFEGKMMLKTIQTAKTAGGRSVGRPLIEKRQRERVGALTGFNVCRSQLSSGSEVDPDEFPLWAM